MCRALAYIGEPVWLRGLLHAPDNALVAQSLRPQLLNALNLAGFGMAAWLPEAPDRSMPLTYRSTTLPPYDGNLRSLSDTLRASCLLAHVRGILEHPDAGFGPQNLHPFRFEGYRWALAHNGDLAHFDRMRPGVLRHTAPEIAVQIRGTTDSEWVYALLMSQLSDPTRETSTEELLDALLRTIAILRELRSEAGIEQTSSMNLFLADGRRVVVLRFTFDFGCYPLDVSPPVPQSSLSYLSLWYTAGERFALSDGVWRMIGGGASSASVLVASEPLTRDASGWVEVPEYSALVVEPGSHARHDQSMTVVAVDA